MQRCLHQPMRVLPFLKTVVRFQTAPLPPALHLHLAYLTNLASVKHVACELGSVVKNQRSVEAIPILPIQPIILQMYRCIRRLSGHI